MASKNEIDLNKSIEQTDDQSAEGSPKGWDRNMKERMGDHEKKMAKRSKERKHKGAKDGEKSPHQGHGKKPAFLDLPGTDFPITEDMLKRIGKLLNIA